MTIGSRPGTLGPSEPIGIRDTTLTDGQLCVWHGAMTNEMLLPILPRMDGAGFRSIEIMDPAAFNACTLVAGEDPWERIRLAAKRLTHTPVAVSLAGTYLFGDAPAGADDARQTVQALTRSGIAVMQVYDPLNHVERAERLITLANDAGLQVVGAIVFALGEAYDNDYFIQRARALKQYGCEAIALLDFAGILHPERVRDIVPALRGELGSTTLEIRTHCRSGRAEISCFAALDNGVETLHAACEVVAGGDSVPSSDYFVEHLEREGFKTLLNADAIAAVCDYFGALADALGLPIAEQRLYDPNVDRHQFPIESEWQMTPAYDDIIRARADAGEPPMAPPTSLQFCGAMPQPQRAVRVSDREAWGIAAETPLQLLIAELERRPWVTRIRVQKGDFALETAL